MTCFEVFTLMFFALDDQYDRTPSEELGDYLSGANPFLFKDIGSADPDVYESFKKKFITSGLDASKSYEFVKGYIADLGLPKVAEAFDQMRREDWLAAAAKYAVSEHKK